MLSSALYKLFSFLIMALAKEIFKTVFNFLLMRPGLLARKKSEQIQYTFFASHNISPILFS